MSYLYSFVVYLYVNGSGSIASVWGTWFVCCCLPVMCGFCLERFPLPLGAWDWLRYNIVLPGPSI